MLVQILTVMEICAQLIVTVNQQLATKEPAMLVTMPTQVSTVMVRPVLWITNVLP